MRLRGDLLFPLPKCWHGVWEAISVLTATTCNLWSSTEFHLALPHLFVEYCETYERYYRHRTWMKTEKGSLQRILVIGGMHLIIDLNNKKTSKGWVKRAYRQNGEMYWQSMIFFCNSTGMWKGMNFSLHYKLILPAQIFLIQSKRASGKGFRTKKEILTCHFILSVFIVMSH